MIPPIQVRILVSQPAQKFSNCYSFAENRVQGGKFLGTHLNKGGAPGPVPRGDGADLALIKKCAISEDCLR